ncbi:MAG: hypothetical protein ABFS56_13070 [Pseudomonadota bacterium]
MILKTNNIDAAKLTKNILGQASYPDLFKESPGQMVKRVCSELGKDIIVINDEAHHCYHRKPTEEKSEKLTGDARKEAERNAQEARTWITGLEQIKNKLGINVDIFVDYIIMTTNTDFWFRTLFQLKIYKVSGEEFQKL